MKYYERLIDKGCFTRGDVVALTGNENSAHSLLYFYRKRGLIDRVRRDLFVAMSLETKQPVPNRYSIASHAADGAYVTHHSAFEYYGFANQVFYEVYAASKVRFQEFEYDGIVYKRTAPSMNAGVVEKRDGVRVTDIERTVVDSINDFEKIGGLEEILRCIELVPSLDASKLMEYLAEYNKGFLYQRSGYILEYFKNALKLPGYFFTACRNAAPKSKRYLYSGLIHEPHILNKDWRLFVPGNLSSLTNKGGSFIE